MIDKDVIKSQQQKILDAIFEEKKKVSSPRSLGLLKEIATFHPNIVVGTLGEVGQKLLRFSEAIDLENPHPDIEILCDGTLVSSDEGSFNRVITDILDVKEFCAANGICSYVSNSLSGVAESHPSWRTVSAYIDDPAHNLQNVRFIGSREKRDAIRSQKEWQQIGLNSVNRQKEGNYFWENCPNDFSFYARGNNVYKRDVKEAKSRIKHMKKHRLDSMAEEVELYLQSLYEKMKEETCFGFNQISLSLTAVIIGKQIGVDFSVKSKPYDIPVLKATVSKDWGNNFFKTDWDLKSSVDSNVEYKPRAYPLHEVWDKTSDEVKQVVDHLESFPEINGNALFDHYRVVVPSFPFPRVGLDLWLMELGYTTGVLLGERNGKHYFICYWGNDGIAD